MNKIRKEWIVFVALLFYFFGKKVFFLAPCVVSSSKSGIGGGILDGSSKSDSSAFSNFLKVWTGVVRKGGVGGETAEVVLEVFDDDFFLTGVSI